MSKKTTSTDFILTINQHQCKVNKSIAEAISTKLNRYISNNKISNNFICEIPGIKKNQYSLISNLFKGNEITITDENFEFYVKIENFFQITYLRNRLDEFQREFNGNICEEYQETDENLQDVILFERNLFDFHNNDIKKLISDIQSKNKYLTNKVLMTFIFNFCVCRHNFIDYFINADFLLDQFISFINQKNIKDQNINDDHEYLFVSSYLISKNLNENGLLSFNIFKNFNNNSINFYLSGIIRNDDIDQFQSFLISHQSYLCNSRTHYLHIYNCCNELNDFCDLMKYSAFFGSLKIYKFLLLNKYLSDCDVFLYSIAGGNSEIIRISEINLSSFIKDSENSDIYLKAMKIAVIYHQNDIFEWIFSNNQQKISERSFIDDIFKLTIKYTNFYLFDFIINSGYFKLNQYLLKNFQKILMKAKNDYDFWIIHVFLMIVDKKTRQSLMTKNLKNGMSPLSFAVEMNDSYFSQILFDFNECKSFNLLERKNSEGKNILQIAIEKGNIEIVKYIFVFQSYIVKIAKDSKKNPLLDACQNRKFDIFKEMVDAYDKINLKLSDTLLNKYDKSGISIQTFK